MIVGVNADSLHFIGHHQNAMAIIGVAGFQSVRDTMDLRIPISEQRLFENAMRGRGMWPLRVLCSESFTPDEWRDGRFADRIQWWRDQMGPDAWWEAGNEPEEGAGRSSSTQSPAHFAQLMVDARSVLGPRAHIISGGLVSGNPWWPRDKGIESELQECTGFGNHLYEMSPDENEPQLTLFHDRILAHWIGEAERAAREYDLPLYITELGALRRYASEGLRAEVYGRGCDMLEPYVEGIWPFGVTGVDEYALRQNILGRPLPVWEILSDIASMHQPASPIEQEKAMKIEELLANVGTWPDGHGVTAGEATVAPSDISVIGGTAEDPVRMAILNTEADQIVIEQHGYATIIQGSQVPKA